MADGKALYANGNPPAPATASRRAKRPFSILRFEPFAAAPKPTAEEAASYAKWVAQLGASRHRLREDATARLRKAGRKALSHLKRAARSADPEVAMRAKAIVAALVKGGLTVLQKDASLVTLCELAAGRLSAVSDPRRAYVVDVATDKAAAHPSQLLLIDRRGSVGLFLHVKDRMLRTAKIVKR